LITVGLHDRKDGSNGDTREIIGGRGIAIGGASVENRKADAPWRGDTLADREFFAVNWLPGLMNLPLV
jgi:hypothetical protein